MKHRFHQWRRWLCPFRQGYAPLAIGGPCAGIRRMRRSQPQCPTNGTLARSRRNPLPNGVAPLRQEPSRPLRHPHQPWRAVASAVHAAAPHRAPASRHPRGRPPWTCGLKGIAHPRRHRPPRPRPKTSTAARRKVPRLNPGGLGHGHTSPRLAQKCPVARRSSQTN